MGKGPQAKSQTRVDYGQQSALDRRNEYIPVLQDQLAGSQNRYNQSLQGANQDYQDIMNRYRGLADQNVDPITYNRSNELGSAFKGFQNFADTGGYSEADIANMRARGISPIRAVYANAMNNLARQKNLSGGYAPNLPAATRSMARSLSSQIADQTTDVNARLAEAIQQGKQFGLSGLGNLSIQDLQLGQQAKLANAQAARDKAALLGGMSSLYSSTPGQARMFGDEVQANTQRLLNQENQFMNQQNNLTNQYLQAQQMPTAFQAGMQNVGQIGKIGAGIASAFINPASGAIPPGSLSGAQLGEYW